MHDFEARDEAELSMSKGQSIRLAPKELQPTGLRGWLLAASSDNSKLQPPGSLQAGLVPANRIKVIGRRMRTLENPSQGKEKPDIVKSSNNK